ERGGDGGSLLRGESSRSQHRGGAGQIPDQSTRGGERVGTGRGGGAACKSDLLRRALAAAAGPDVLLRIGARDPALSLHQPARIERSERGAQVVKAGDHGEGLFRAAGRGVRQGVAGGASECEGGESRREDRGEQMTRGIRGVKDCELRSRGG